MTALNQVRSTFTDYFKRNGHEHVLIGDLFLEGTAR